MLWLLALVNAGLIFVLLQPAPVATAPDWDGSATDGAADRWEQLRSGQATAAASVGLTMSPGTLLALRIGMAGAGALAMGLLLGPVSAVCGGIAGWLGVQEWLNARKEARLLQFADQFREVLQSITNSLRAGRAMQQALAQAQEDLLRIPGRHQGLMALELSHMLEELRLNHPLDQVIDGLQNRVPLEEVRLFADAVRICRIRGGNLVQVLQTLVKLNVDRFQVRQEIRVQTAQKRMEGSMMSVMPLVMLLLLTLIAPDYMAPLTRTVIGQALVGLGLLAVLVAFLINRNLTRIEV